MALDLLLEHSLRYCGQGLAGIALGLGYLEYVLDRGERSNWFSSSAITTAAIVACVALLLLAYHELWRAKHPVLQLRLLTNRNFCAGEQHDLLHVFRTVCQHSTSS
jgi:DHA2 family multidrug resistance protein